MERSSSRRLSIDTKRKRKASSAQPWHSVEDGASPEKGYDSPSKKRFTREDSVFETANRLYREKSASRGRSRSTTPRSPSPLPGPRTLHSASKNRESSADDGRSASEVIDERHALDSDGHRIFTDGEIDSSPEHAALTLPNRRYVDVINSMIADVNDPQEQPLNDAGGSVQTPGTSQVGMSYWTGSEKDRFFKAVSRYGVHDLERISRHIGSKSDLEVRQYVLLLNDTIDSDPGRFWYQRHLAPPVAAEISDQTCGLSDRAAETVVAYQAAIDAQWERHYFGAYWLLDTDTTANLEKLVQGTQNDARTSVIRAEDTNSNVRSRLVPAMYLLRLPEWIALSAHFFSNVSAPAPIEEAPNAAPPQAEYPSQFMPGMHATAALDFHTLTVSVTRRLVAAALFQADSRLRAREPVVFEVTLGDVETAIDVLGMSRDAVAFWAKMPRRCGLDVYDYDPANRSWPVLWGKDIAQVKRNADLGPRLSYDEVEKRLGLVQGRSTTDGVSTSAEVSLDESSTSDDSSASSLPALPSLPSTRSPTPDPDLDPEDQALRSMLTDTMPPSRAQSPHAPQRTHPRTRQPDSPPRWSYTTAPAAHWEQHGVLAPSSFATHAAADADLAARVRARWTRLPTRSNTSTSASRSRSRSRNSTPAPAPTHSSAASALSNTDANGGGDGDGDLRMADAAAQEDEARGRAPMRRAQPVRSSRSRTPRYVVDGVEAGGAGGHDDYGGDSDDESDVDGDGAGAAPRREEIADSEDGGDDGEDGEARRRERARAAAVQARALEMMRGEDGSDGDEYVPSSPVRGR